MASLFSSGKVTAAASSVVVAGIGIAALLFWHFRGESLALPDTAPAGFQEAAIASGITWQHHLLPAEQGEAFKVNLYDHSSGVAIGDVDGDGHDDVYFVNQLGPNVLYRNKGDGTFEDITEKAGVALGDRICVAAAFADYDNSGRQSLFVTSTRGGNVLFKNMGGGIFKDVTKEAGLTHVGHSQACLWFDYDNDGYLDLLVTNTASWTTDQLGGFPNYYRGPGDLFKAFGRAHIESNILYHNNRDGTFTDVTAKSGLAGKGWCGDVAVIDYDDDGLPDLLVTAMFGGTTLYHNKGHGSFEDVTDTVLGPTSWGAMGCAAFDYMNEGRLDLYTVDMHSDMWMGVDYDWTPQEVAGYKQFEKKKYSSVWGPRGGPAINVAGRKPGEKYIFGNTLFHNLGHGKFEEVSDKAGMETFWPWGIAAGDFDNDGYVDVFIPSGMGYPFWYWPNQMMMNNHDGTFTERAAQMGIEPPARGEYFDEKISDRLAARSSRCAAVADFDGDGRLDIVVNNFNDVPYYFRNHLPRKNYIAFRLRGTRCNRDAIGAEVRLYRGKQILTRQVNSFGGYLTQSSRTLHFGLGDRTDIDRVEIRWPGSRTVQTIEHYNVNALNEVVQK